jgi:hypothetical protein
MQAVGIQNYVMFPGKPRVSFFGIGMGAVLVILALLMITSWTHRHYHVAPHAPLYPSPGASP